MCSLVLSALNTSKPIKQSKTRLLAWSKLRTTVGSSLAVGDSARNVVVVSAPSTTSWHSFTQDFSGSISRVLWQRIVTTPGHKGSVTKRGRLKRRATPTLQEEQIPPKPEKMESHRAVRGGIEKWWQELRLSWESLLRQWWTVKSKFTTNFWFLPWIAQNPHQHWISSPQHDLKIRVEIELRFR